MADRESALRVSERRTRRRSYRAFAAAYATLIAESAAISYISA
jgi:hypothetical protein